MVGQGGLEPGGGPHHELGLGFIGQEVALPDESGIADRQRRVPGVVVQAVVLITAVMGGEGNTAPGGGVEAQPKIAQPAGEGGFLDEIIDRLEFVIGLADALLLPAGIGKKHGPGDFRVAQGRAFGDGILIVIGKKRGEDHFANDGDGGNPIGEDRIEEGVAAAGAVLARPFALHPAGKRQPVKRSEQGVEVEDMRFLFQGDVRNRAIRAILLLTASVKASLALSRL